jgi:hypothetical protein
MSNAQEQIRLDMFRRQSTRNFRLKKKPKKERKKKKTIRP